MPRAHRGGGGGARGEGEGEEEKRCGEPFHAAPCYICLGSKTMKVNRTGQDVPSSVKRRMSGRFRAVVYLPARIGRKDGTVLDISRGSARVRHVGSIEVGTQLQLSFTSPQGRFAGNATVTSCRVVGVSEIADGATEFESLIRFANLTPEAVALLERIVVEQEG